MYATQYVRLTAVSCHQLQQSQVKKGCKNDSESASREMSSAVGYQIRPDAWHYVSDPCATPNVIIRG